MISNPMKYLGTLALLLALTVVLTMRPVEAEAGPFENARVKLLIQGMGPDEAMADQAKLIRTLEDFGVARWPANQPLKHWIEAIEESDSSGSPSPLLRGLGGISARALLWAAKQTANPGFVDRPGAETSGQIASDCDGVQGYAFNANGSGLLCVTMTTTTTRGHSNITETMTMKFKVVVDAGGFIVEEKDLTFANNVFPNFARAAGLMVNSETATGFQFKLWASGNSIHVTKIWVNGTPYDATTAPPKYDSIFLGPVDIYRAAMIAATRFRFAA
jgi:hypothetical protein